MAGETILVAGDEPAGLKVTCAFLADEGYKVITASSGAEAVDLLRTLTPDLIFADLQSEDWNRLGVARLSIKNERTRDVLVIAAASPGEEAKVLDAGCDAYLARPVDMRALGLRIREMLDNRAVARAGSRKEATAAELRGLRVRFLAEGLEKSRELLLQLDERFEAKEAARVVHQWIGTGGLLGYAAISSLAREAETILAEQPLDNASLRESLANLALAFSSPREAHDEPLPPSIVEALAGQRIAAVEFPAREQELISSALERVGAQAVFLSAGSPPDSKEAASSIAALVHVNSKTIGSAWLDASRPFDGRRPMVLAGTREDLLALPQSSQSLAREFLMDSWQADEALVRLSLAIANRSQGNKAEPRMPSLSVRAKVVIADDDPAMLGMVRAALENFEMDCFAASDGATAIETIRKLRPQAAVLDVDMPGMDGYQVLTAVRQDALPVRVLLLTARQQESDIVRGFSLGADDYVVKPFSPMELVARLKRLLSR
jgi:DNA-binding response OmpR family regulator